MPPAAECASIAGVPALIERPGCGVPSGSVLVYHGATASKEEALGQFTALTGHGLEVIYLDAPLHGERKPQHLEAWIAERGYRNYVWESVRHSTREAASILDALNERAPDRPIAVIGTSMGGYVAHWLLANEPRARAGAIISSHSRWQDPDVNPDLAAWLASERPDRQAHRVPPKPVIVIHGGNDDAVPTQKGLESHAVLRDAYAAVGLPERLALYVAPGVGHATSPEMARRAISWLAEQPWREQA